MMSEKTQERKYDNFIANKIYPKPINIFKPDFKNIGQIKDTASIVFDTNVLLLPYTVSSASLGEIRKTYSKLIGERRLFIPGQVAREFASNRPIKICDLHKALLDKKSKLDVFKHDRYPFLEDIFEYKELIRLEKEIESLLKDYKKNIGGILEKIQSWNWDDPVSLMYSQILNEEVMIEPKTDEKSLLEDLERRQIHKIPPGYKDANKDDSGIGDLLIWKTILQLGKEKNNDVIFVTSDLKADWWHGSNKQNIYPRYELIDEFRRETNGRTISIIEFSTLLNLYGASEDIVAEVKQEEDKLIDKNTLTTDDENNHTYSIERHMIRHLLKLTDINESNNDISNLLIQWFLSRYSPMIERENINYEDKSYTYIHVGSYVILNLFKENFPFVSKDMIMKSISQLSDISCCWERTNQV